jgi:Methyltransferase domain
MAEVEGFGVDYERFALGRLLARLAKRYRIREVLEMPALGAKAMPSIYSLGWAMAGCRVTLLNGQESALPAWKKLGLADRVCFFSCENLTHTPFGDDAFDLVWNFAFFPTCDAPDKVLHEMRRVSRRYVAAISVNRYNPGFLIHRLVHRYTHIPWTHGDTAFNVPGRVKRFFASNGVRPIRVGVVDCPPWPDSLGFRDVRLHRMPMDLNAVAWHSNLVDYTAQNRYPAWIRAVYAFERMLAPFPIKYLYAHLFYVIGEKTL